MIGNLSSFNAEEIKILPPELTLFLLPVGGLEAHGSHLPLGTKLFHAEALATELADKLQALLPAWNFVLLPLLPLSVDSVTNQFALNVRPHVVRDAVVDQCEQLKRVGFLNFACVSAHLTPKQLSALEDASSIVSRSKWFGGRKGQLISVSSALIESKAVWDSPMIALPKEHAGAYDTGLVLKLQPALVNGEYQSLPALPKPKASISRFVSYLKHEVGGYWGKPAEALPELAYSDLSREVDILAQKMLPWLEQGKGQGIFRSGYRYFPINGSFFKAYLLAVIFFLLMLIWVIWGVKDAFEG